MRQLHVGACPRCRATVVLPRPKRERPADRLKARLTMPALPDDGQLLAACPEHGWAPFNERSLKLRRPDRGSA